MTIKMFSMFSGIGGFELAAKSIDKDIELIGYSEIDKYAIEVFNRHFPGVKNYGDATRIDTRELPDFDLLVGGFPCQAFSVAGQQKGFDDTRGTLFFETARILRDKKPKCFLLENVKGLISHDSGHSFKRILGVCSDLGYDIEWEVLNSKDFGVPQNRERIFIVGYLADGRGGGRKIFPITSSHTENGIKRLGHSGSGGQKGDILGVDGLSTSLTATDYKQPKQIKVEGTLDQQDVRGHDILRRVYGAKGLSPTIPTGMGGNTMPKVALKIDRKGKIKKDQNVASALTVGGHGHGNHSDMDLIVTPVQTRIRRLTPTECERLQGFPDGWTEGLSDSQRYKTLGNAVTVNVVAEVLKALYKEQTK